MRAIDELINFLQNKMSMTEIYQPAVILYLLQRDGTASRADLAKVLSGLDELVQEEYDEILMRWPKITLTKHDIVIYDKATRFFTLNFNLNEKSKSEYAATICDEKIRNWIERRSKKDNSKKPEASKRYRVLKAARGKCELCGISSKIRPIDIDHIIPRKKVNKNDFITKDGILMHIDDERNLQALCSKCNRAKRNHDDTDFRIRNTLVRDNIPAIMELSGEKPITKIIPASQLAEKLSEKLIDEHAKFIQSEDIEELVDMIEVLISIAREKGQTEEQLMSAVRDKRNKLGGFYNNILLEGIFT